jgi:hypothetical protein
MPRRSNLFQDVVAIIHAHMAEGATVEESALLVNRATGEEREVDVIIRDRSAGHEITVAVEAAARSRRAGAPWVEEQVGKHKHLPTDKLVLVSESGFTPQARALAEAEGVIALAPEDVSDTDPAYSVVNRLREIWPKTITLSGPSKVRMRVVRPSAGDDVWIQVMPGHTVYLDDGEEVGSVLEVVQAFLEGTRDQRIPSLEPYLRDIAETTTRTYVVGVGSESPWVVRIDNRERRLCLREESGGELHPINEMQVIGEAVIEVADPVALVHRRLGDVMYSYGEGTVAGRKALVLITESEQGGQATFRIRPADESA